MDRFYSLFGSKAIQNKDENAKKTISKEPNSKKTVKKKEEEKTLKV